MSGGEVKADQTMPRDSSLLASGVPQSQHIARLLARRLGASLGKSTGNCSSYVTSFQSRASSAADFVPGRGPLSDLTDILNTLLQNDIPGPSLLRLDAEFNHLLGRGAQFEVLGISPEASSASQNFTNDKDSATTDACVVESLRRLRSYAIKRAISRVVSTTTSTSSSSTATATQQSQHDSALALGFQLHCAKTEIEKLCYKPFRDHANIVKLLGWGLDLDILEDPRIQTPRIPVLILERANLDLAQFMRRHKLLPPSLERSICADIGCGLELLHGEQIYHGDLKLENVLMFLEGSKWTAKLCDFGLAATASEDRTPTVEYRGTEGWRPPEADSFQLLVPKLVFQCDVFAYGLIVWAVYTGRHESPIRGRSFHDQEGTSQRYSHAALRDMQREKQRRKIAIQKKVFLLPIVTGSDDDSRRLKEIKSSKLHAEAQLDSEINRALKVIIGSLHTNPVLRHQKPWRYLDPSSALYQDENKPIRRILSTMRSVAGDATHALRSKALQLAGYRRTLPNGNALSSHPIAMARQAKTWFKSHQLSLKLQIQHSGVALLHNNGPHPRLYHDVHLLYTANMFLDKPWDVNRISTFSHPLGHHDLRPLMQDLLHCLETPLRQYTQYQSRPLVQVENMLPTDGRTEECAKKCALARLRSRFSQCCWSHAAQLLNLHWGLRSNVLRRTLYVNNDFSTLAWLCRGEIGKLELQSLRPDPNLIWYCIFDPSLGITDRLARFILLWESGCYIQDFVTIGPRRQSAFFHMLIVLQQIGYEAKGTHELIRHVKRISEMQGTPSESRFFLTGRSEQLVDHGPSIDTATSRSTALHEAVDANSYLAVELLIRSGFSVNALDHKGKTAFERAVSPRNHRVLDLEEKNRRDRIIVLLQQGARRPTTSALPRGWEMIHLKNPLHPAQVKCGYPTVALAFQSALSSHDGPDSPLLRHLLPDNPTSRTRQASVRHPHQRPPSETFESLSSRPSSTYSSESVRVRYLSVSPNPRSLKGTNSPSGSRDVSPFSQGRQRHFLAVPRRRKPKTSAYPYALRLMNVSRPRSHSHKAQESLYAPPTVSETVSIHAKSIQSPAPRRFKDSAIGFTLELNSKGIREMGDRVYWPKGNDTIWNLLWTCRRLDVEDSWTLRPSLTVNQLRSIKSFPFRTFFDINLWLLDYIMYCHPLSKTVKSWLTKGSFPSKPDTNYNSMTNFFYGEIGDAVLKPSNEDNSAATCSMRSKTSPEIDTVYYERHTQSVTFVKPKISILEHQRLALGLQAIAQSEQYIRSDSQLFGLDLVPFINRNSLRNMDREEWKVKFKPSTEPIYGEEWYLDDVNRSS